jgi:hypothetical protein
MAQFLKCLLPQGFVVTILKTSLMSQEKDISGAHNFIATKKDDV